MRIGRDLLAVTSILILWAALLEASLHVAGVKLEGSLYMQDQTRRFRLRPNARAWYNEEGEIFVTVNSRGFRDRERVPGPHPGVFRIAVVGDSAVAGLQVPESQTFTEVAERLLGPRVEVLNFGEPNYGLAQQYLTLRDDVFTYQPDLVVEAVTLTNAILNSAPETSVKDSPYPYFSENEGHLKLNDVAEHHWLSPAAESALSDAENRTDLVLLFLQTQRVLTAFADKWGRRFHLKSPLPDHFYDRSLAPSTDPAVVKTWRISELTLAAMRNLCAAHQVPFWILTLDHSAQDDPDPKMSELFFRTLGHPDPYYADSRLIRFAQAEEIPSIQAAPVLADYAKRTGQTLHGFFNTARNWGHLNATGHAVVGHLLAERVQAAFVQAAAP